LFLALSKAVVMKAVNSSDKQAVRLREAQISSAPACVVHRPGSLTAHPPTDAEEIDDN